MGTCDKIRKLATTNVNTNCLKVQHLHELLVVCYLSQSYIDRWYLQKYSEGSNSSYSSIIDLSNYGRQFNTFQPTPP